MIYLYNDDNTISKNIITFKDKNELEKIRKSIRDNDSYLMSLKIIDECFIPRFKDQEVTNLLFFNMETSGEILRDILLSEMSLESKRTIINDMELFRDFCFFSKMILDRIKFQEIGNYEMDKMEEIKRQSDQLGLSSEASDILSQREWAEKNQKVLTLARKVREL